MLSASLMGESAAGEFVSARAEGNKKASDSCSRSLHLLRKAKTSTEPSRSRAGLEPWRVFFHCVAAVCLVCGALACNHTDESHLGLLHQAKVCPASQLFGFVSSTGSGYYHYSSATCLLGSFALVLGVDTSKVGFFSALT